MTPSYFANLIDLLETETLVMLAAYFDESGTHEGSPITCVAGYVFKHNDALKFSRRWGQVLRANNLPYFRMSECVASRGEFTGRTMEEGDRLERTLIGLVKRYASVGVAVTVRDSDYVKVAGPEGTPYGLCLLWCVTSIAMWANKYQPSSGKIAYFFEAGHPRQSFMNRAMNELALRKNLHQEMRYGSHSFIGKHDARQLQAADLLAWLWAKDRKDQLLGTWKAHRKDLDSLMGLTHLHKHFGPEELHDFANHDPRMPMKFRLEGARNEGLD